ncbi:Zinc-binding oxidoreductase [Phaffia rhodozyma]|uniref:Zinc-binding oxidoreductase n=1 Tax=Phaffia rhodozyma TaxID=264483 RepID=A0A0F7SPC6_PHARH|nr:Zinc-binding oxidoreductase [Phaffia rhodozyma]
MKAFVVEKHAHPTKISVSHHSPAPVAKKGEILVDVYSCGLNFFDVLQAQNKYQLQPPLPFVLGTEFAGVVSKDAVIPTGSVFKAGDKVFGAAQGSFAEQVAVHHTQLLPVPPGITFDEAAGLCITWPTSWEGIVERGQAKKGDWVLVHAGAGGVGLPAIQIAKSLGCKVIATASSADKLEICKKHGGADFGIDYSKDSWQKEVLEITGGKGVDVVFDPVGLLIPSLKVAAWKCRLIVVGFAAGAIEKIPANLILLKNVSVVGLHLGAYYKKEPSQPPVIWGELFKGLHNGAYRPVVYDRVYNGLDKIGTGLADIESRKTWGKVIVHVRDSQDVKARL